MKTEITLIELTNGKGRLYKVTKKIAELRISETKIFRQKWRATEQVEDWLR